MAKISNISGVVPHSLALILTVISTFLFFLVLLDNAPLDTLTISRSNAAGRFWLVTITDKLAVDKPVLGIGSATPGVGFGVWGWCNWISAQVLDQATCKTKAFWRLPADADLRDPVNALDLPASIRNSLSIASFFLIGATASSLFALILLIIALIDPPFEPQNAKGNCIPSHGLSPGTWASYVMVNRTRGWSAVVFNIVWTLPTLIVVGISIDGVNGNGSAYNAGLGVGSASLIAAIVTFVLATLLAVYLGLLVNTRKVHD